MDRRRLPIIQQDPWHMRPVTRREMLRVGFLGAAGLTLGDFLKLQSRAAAQDFSMAGAQDPTSAAIAADARAPSPGADSVIYIFLEGGMSHIDSFDPKPLAPIEIRGELGTVEGNVSGVQFSGLWRQTAQLADKLAVIRSMTHGEAAHERGTHNMLTGYKPSPAVTYPSMGCVVSHELGMRNSLPPYICVPDASSGSGFAGTGYLSSAFGPFSLGGEPQSDQFVVRDLNLPAGVDETRMARRKGLLSTVDAHFRSVEKADQLDAMETFYQRAYDLISSPTAREAFNIQAEPAAVRDAYGRTAIGQRLLMARRLIEAGTRFVTVFFGGWDMHIDLHAGMRSLVPPLDQAYAALLRDLESRGLLGSTLVVLSTEFGRTTRINKDRGRDHWPKVFSIVFAGGGVRGGQVIGESNAYATEPKDRPVTPGDVAATLFTQLGIDPSKNLMSPGDRPVRIVRDGAAIAGLV